MQTYAAPFAILEATFVFVSGQIELRWPLKTKVGNFCRTNTVYRQCAFVIEVAKAADQIKVDALLSQAQGHDVVAAPLTAGITIVDLEPAVFIQGLADGNEGVRVESGWQQGLRRSEYTYFTSPFFFQSGALGVAEFDTRLREKPL